MKRIIRLLNLRDESGAALVLVAILMVALLGFTALAIDGGRLFSEKSQLQKALDSAVLAGAQGLRTSKERAVEIAVNVSQENGLPITEDDLNITNDSIRATKQINVPLTFARVLGLNNAAINAIAKAEVAPLKSSGGIAPIAVTKSDVLNHGTVTGFVALNCEKDNSGKDKEDKGKGDGNTDNPGENQGNCGYLDLGEKGGGAAGVADDIINGSDYEIGTTVLTKPGQNVGPVDKAIETIINNDKDKAQCNSPTTADNSCDRVITLVVIDTWDDVHGSDQRNVVGFASYWVDRYENKTIYAKLIKIVAPGEIGAGTEIGEYNLYGVKLVE
jgi:hypothetical protein